MASHSLKKIKILKLLQAHHHIVPTSLSYTVMIVCHMSAMSEVTVLLYLDQLYDVMLCDVLC